MTKKKLNELREVLVWCERTARRWSVPYTWCLSASRGRYYFGPRDHTLTEKVKAMCLAIWGNDMTKGYTSKAGTPCIMVELGTIDPKPRNEWDWEVLANI